ncbi:hypothetical protein SAMN03080598_01895 [Algoriphagus boritolerans DSM 17298 = JCM 18970]|jgi:hypothetical protein|uniref:Uncharacterized protein n=1 Tax=Algoriphagus boritolerans DSM 17298 = JCM 18970 TaxID=1120964 RepID=A0A1H5VZ13_9BACT|nr:hypothetical protein SAMN03080598_01895 [Algoriphagus boritolerans DSM 17298 = JCM 18970]
MKRIVLILFLVGLSFYETSSQTVSYTCPTGDQYRCVQIGDFVVPKGPGESIHKIE